MKKTLLSAVIVAAAISACTLEKPDEQAGAMLNEARLSMVAGQWNAARSTIMAMRQQYPRAIRTRRAAILTLDTLEIMAATDSLNNTTDAEVAERLAVKQQFFLRKLEQDLKTAK